MSSIFNKTLEKIRAKSSNTVEQGSAFEKLSKIYFENDDIQKQQFNKIWHYKDWAKENPNFSKTDIGIDLVGELKNDKGLAAIQCKFFRSDHQITKEDLDSFVSASSSEIFTRLILIDTSNEDLGPNAKSMIDNLNKTYHRIQKYDLENSRIDWLEYIENDKIILSNKKEPRDHQIKAIEEAKKYYSSNSRGKMIMACGTGKTYTSLKIAETIANKKFILYMVPSLALMSQTIREWKNDCEEDFIAFSACSDKKIGKVKNDNDLIQVKLNELAIPATTDSKKLAEEILNVEKNKMIVVFSTYQSIEVISDAQKKFNMNSFDLIICDEAHRTTGATFEDQEESHFVKIHEDKYVEGKKRLYMTATPRIFGNKAKKKADEGRVELASMDDPDKYGKEFFNRGFNWAVENNLLSDYKVVILAVDEGLVSSNLQKSLEDGSELNLTDATKIIGVYKALAKVGFDKNENEKLKPIKKAIAFTQSIEISKIFQKEFSRVISEYVKNENIKEQSKVDLNVEVQHIDGTFNADQRNNNLNWLKDDTENNICRILSNVKCLSEGVDVPSLDAIMFLHPKKSQIDVVQAVGRVMRKAEGKKLGYVIIPVTVAPGVSPEKALNDNEKYKVVWQIVNALRTHDERLDGKVNMLSLGEDISDKIEIVTMSAEQDATTAKVDDVKKKKQKKDKEEDVIINIDQNDEKQEDDKTSAEDQMSFELDDLSQAIKAKIVQKCGTRDYWENWSSDIAKIAKEHINNINSIIVKSNSKEKKVFDSFLKEIRDDLNPEISENDAVEMLAQHIITKPVFDILFDGNEFTKENSISRAIQFTVDKIYSPGDVGKDSTLNNFYESVKRRSSGIITSKGKSKLINELYERFFKNAFPLTTQKLGIVYTPIEIVDFMISSTQYLLDVEFNKKLSDKKVSILDPFTGTGTFINRLLSSEIFNPTQLKYKYENEIHANEIILLAYYIATINIESTYHSIIKSNQYQPFNGSVLTDTFQLYEQERDLIADLLPDNSKKRTRQKKSPITIIISNPPYSIGQKSENDNAQNIKYLNLDEKIRNTYGKNSQAVRQSALYDSYIRSFRWASDRLSDDGIIAYITNASWIDNKATDGFRKTLFEEFSSIYVINLRGNARTAGELRKKEGGNIFGSGSRTPIAITFLIKNSKSKKKGEIFYYDIGDYFDRKQKLNKIKQFSSIKTIVENKKFENIIPNKNNDWLNKGNDKYDNLKLLSSKDKNEKNKIFEITSSGVVTSRDKWCYNFSKTKLKQNIELTINFYNQQLNKIKIKNKNLNIEQIKNEVSNDKKKISWSRGLFQKIQKKKRLIFDESKIMISQYRPFIKTYVYFDKDLNEVQYQLGKIFNKHDKLNPIIACAGSGNKNDFSALMINDLPDFQVMFNSQCYSLNTYNDNNLEDGLFSNQFEKHSNFEKVDNINEKELIFVKKFYSDKTISKHDIFYYIYGLLHSKEFINDFSNNLKKESIRILYVKILDDFKNFVKIGKKLSELHINFENQKKYPCKIVNFDKDIKDKKSLFRVNKMHFKKVKKVTDRTVIIYNNLITLENIPLDTYDYEINGKSAVEWVMDKQMIMRDDDTGIINDPNDYANETMKNPAYPLELIQKVITVSLETNELVKRLPKLKI